MISTCACCGREDSLFSKCPDCGKHFALTCYIVHRKRAHGYQPTPEEEYRNNYLYRLPLLP